MLVNDRHRIVAAPFSRVLSGAVHFAGDRHETVMSSGNEHFARVQGQQVGRLVGQCIHTLISVRLSGAAKDKFK
jgi:hypothetical protein